MAKAIPMVLGVAAVAVTGGAGLGLVAPLTATLITTGIGIAGNLANTLLAQTPPKPKMADGDVSIKQAIPPRVRGYGRTRVGGTYLFYDSTPDGDLKTLVCHVAHEIDGWEEDWLNDERVQLDDDGNVTDDPWWQDDDDDSVVVIQHYLGTPGQVIPSFDDKWTADHKGHGLCCAYVKYSDLKDEDQVKVFPSGPPPYRAVLRLAKIYDPRAGGQVAGNESTYAWSDNAALVILDYMTRTESGIPVGFGWPLDRVNLESFAAAADICDQTVPLKAGDGEPRWRIWGLYELTEDRKQVLQDMLDSCGGRLTQGSDGRLGLVVGAPAPVANVTLTDAGYELIEWDLNQGKAAIERINEVRATYVSEVWTWAETEAGIQLDQAAIDRNGTESSQIKLRFVPSESQAQRCAREVLKRGNPSHAGRIRASLAALDAWGERWVRLQIDELGINQVFEITSMSLNQADMTVSMEVASCDDWWEWNAAVDEQDPAIPPPDADDDDSIPVPTGVVVTIEHRKINGQTYAAIGVISWAPPPRKSYTARVRYRPVTTPVESAWQPLPVTKDANTVKTDPLEDGQGYEAQVRFIGSRGSAGDWSASAPFTAIADPTIPDAPLVPLAAVAGTVVQLQTTAANNPNTLPIRFWRDSDTSFAGAVDVSGPLYTAPNSIANFDDTPGPGRWYYWATAENWSGVLSSPAGPSVAADLVPDDPVITSPTTPFLTNDSTPTFSGTGQNGSTVQLFDGVTLKGSNPVSGGAWVITSSTMTDGVHNMTAKAVAGPLTSGSSNTVVTTVDTIVAAPAISTSSPLTTTDTTPDISGTAEPGATINMFRGGSTPAGSTTADGSGNWTCTLSPALAVGSYSITARQTDLAGNTSGASTALTLNVQPAAPAISTVGATTYDTTPTIAGTATAAATIKLYDDGVLSSTSTADGSGNWSFPTGVLATGANTITATQTVAGVEGPASSGITMTVSALDSDAAAYIAAMAVEPTSTRMGLINDLVLAWKAAGVWAKLDRAFLLAAHTSQAACLNLKNPAIALTPTNTPTFVADRGFKGTGMGSTVGGYLASTFNPSTAGGVYVQNSAHLGIWVRTANTSTLASQAGDIGTSGAAIFTKHTTAGAISTLLNDGTTSNTAAGTPNNIEHYVTSRTASTGYAKYHNGAAQASSGVVSTAVPNFNFSILRTGATTYSDAEVCAAHWGSGLTATEVNDLYAALHTYLVAVGAA